MTEEQLGEIEKRAHVAWVAASCGHQPGHSLGVDIPILVAEVRRMWDLYEECVKLAASLEVIQD